MMTTLATVPDLSTPEIMETIHQQNVCPRHHYVVGVAANERSRKRGILFAAESLQWHTVVQCRVDTTLASSSFGRLQASW